MKTPKFKTIISQTNQHPRNPKTAKQKAKAVPFALQENTKSKNKNKARHTDGGRYLPIIKVLNLKLPRLVPKPQENKT